MDYGVPQKCEMCNHTKPLWLFHHRLWCKGCIEHFYYVLHEVLEKEIEEEEKK